MKKKFIPAEFEKNMCDLWKKDDVYRTPEKLQQNKKIYALSMFPYPSGAGLHVGHVRIFTGTDVIARYFRMKGYSVLHPMGWDAFGLPAENAAIKAKSNPIDMVPDNIANFKRQMSDLGLSYDWSREFSTTDPEYYKWTQWLFIQFFSMGLLYKKITSVYFCDFCKTGVAEEEVLADGTHERCQKPITKKDLPQWIFRITDYADRLLSDLDLLDWPAGILAMQRNWIGKKEGINITYKIIKSKVKSQKSKEYDDEGIAEVVCFTTRPDTNFGATFIVLAPEHPFVKKILNGEIELEKETDVNAIKTYIEKSMSKTDQERLMEGKKKTGVFTGFYALNNLNGKNLPVYVSDFVLGNFGTGAVVGVPAHDIRDFQFAKEFGIEVIRVVVAKDGNTSDITEESQVQEEEGTMINSDFLNGLDIHEATIKIMDVLEEKGWGKRVVSYHLRDWIFSRQRYWGEPIPMVYCETCAEKGISEWDRKVSNDKKQDINKYRTNEVEQTVSERIKMNKKDMVGWFTIDEQSLPLELPYMKSYEPSGTGESPLAKAEDWVKATCPNCGGEARRETDTMPNWAGSCWYFIRFAQNQLKSEVISSLQTEFMASGNDWSPVDWYLGGAEHAVLHLLYSRFWVKALYDLKMLDYKEPFLRLRNVGMVLAEDNRKMSKSWGNVINPDDVIKEFGADTLRIHEMFMAPFNQEIAWSTSTLQGAYRFLSRVWNLYQSYPVLTSNYSLTEDLTLVSKLNKTVQRVTKDIGETKFNTAIAGMMEFVNEWEASLKSKDESQKDAGEKMIKDERKMNELDNQNEIIDPVLSVENAKKFLKLLAPYAPFMTEKIWKDIFGESSSIHLSSWPEVDEKAIQQTGVNVPIQVNGKVRTMLELQMNELDEDTVVKKALNDEKVKKYVTDTPKKVIYVKGKILNLVV
ncbi:MAG: leucine--tRNA ligase [Candidatus Roizmanbacteria bacterium]